MLLKSTLICKQISLTKRREKEKSGGWQFRYALASFHEGTLSSGRVRELSGKETIKKMENEKK